MRIITLSNRPIEDDSDLSIRRQPRLLRESSALFGIPVENICPLGEPHDWTGGTRRKLVAEYLRAVPDDEVVLLTDAWDSFFAGTVAELQAAFDAIGSPIVFSPEHNLWPREDAAHLHLPPAPTRFRYACGGGWAGRTGALRSMFSASDFWSVWAMCDQSAFNDWACRHPEQAVVDYHCRLFICMYDDGTARPPIHSLFRLRDGRLWNTETNTCPLVWHAGGGYCAEALKLWDSLKEAKRPC